MKQAVVWDLDGTLLDSYGVIVDSLYQIYYEKGIDIDKKDILHDVINESVSVFIKKMETQFGVPFDDLKDRYTVISHKEKENIKAMKHAKEILEYLKNKGIPNYVFTHRGTTTESVLSNTGLLSFFDEIITSLNSFERKPHPSGLNYFVNKYNLDKENTYYVGDRPLDIECANNAGIKSIMFIPENSPAKATGKESFVVKDLLDIKNII